MSKGKESGLFEDLEEMDHKDINELKGDLERDLKSVVQQHRELREERRNQIDIVRSLRDAVGEIESADGERKSLLKQFHSTRKSAEESREERDTVNICIPPPVDVLSEWLEETHRRLTTIDNDLTAVPTLPRELETFSRFFELQAAIVRKRESEVAHDKYVKHIQKMREITSKLDSTRKSKKKSADNASGQSDPKPDKISRAEVRRTSRRIDKIDKKLDVLSSERKSFRKRLGRIKAYQKVTMRRGQPIRLSDVKDRAKSGGALDASELEVLLNSGTLSELAGSGSDTKEVDPKVQQSAKKKRVRLGVTRGGPRKGTMAARRENDS